jgi:hypothetical protein
MITNELPVAIPAVLAVLFLICCAFWIRFFLRRLWAGPLLLNLRKPHYWLLVGCIFVVLAFIGLFIMQSYRHKSTALAAIDGLMSSWLAIQSVVRDRLELRERGVLWSTAMQPVRFVRWGDIEGFDWKPETNFYFTKESERKDYLTLTVRGGDKRHIAMLSVSRDLREAAEAVVERRLAVAGNTECSGGQQASR